MERQYLYDAFISYRHNPVEKTVSQSKRED